jgi:hypothetical protein
VGLALQTPASAPEIAGLVEAAGLAAAEPPLTSGAFAWIEINGLIEPDAPALKAMAALPNVADTRVLGGYAVPLAQ